MRYQEVKQDLFEVDSSYSLAHCISQDYAMGKGIALTFQERFPEMKKTIQQNKTAIGQIALYEDGDRFILNIMTKESYWHKPSKNIFEFAVRSLKRVCEVNGIKRLAMPRIGSGLDRLDWETNREVIQKIFSNTDIEILVCYQ